VAIGGEDGEVLAEVLVDRLGLGGRLDDEEVLGHGRGRYRCGGAVFARGFNAKAAGKGNARGGGHGRRSCRLAGFLF
jgi:hypothetical protein